MALDGSMSDPVVQQSIISEDLWEELQTARERLRRRGELILQLQDELAVKSVQLTAARNELRWRREKE